MTVRSTIAEWLVARASELTVVCAWARHFILTVPFSTMEYKWVQANCWDNLTDPIQGGVEMSLATP